MPNKFKNIIYLPKGNWSLVEFDGYILVVSKGHEPYIIRNGSVSKVKTVTELAEEFYKISLKPEPK